MRRLLQRRGGASKRPQTASTRGSCGAVPAETAGSTGPAAKRASEPRSRRGGGEKQRGRWLRSGHVVVVFDRWPPRPAMRPRPRLRVPRGVEKPGEAVTTVQLATIPGPRMTGTPAGRRGYQRGRPGTGATARSARPISYSIQRHPSLQRPYLRQSHGCDLGPCTSDGAGVQTVHGPERGPTSDGGAAPWCPVRRGG